MKILEKIVHFLANIVYFLIGVYAVVCIPILLQYHPLVVLSNSMKPSFSVGSVIYYQVVPADSLKKNDIVVFKSKKNEYIAHRIIGIENGFIETKGDSNNASDHLEISIQDVKGKVASFYIPFIGFYIKFVNDHLLIAVPVVFIILLEFLFTNTRIFEKKEKDMAEL